jgi:hypothetical protein
MLRSKRISVALSLAGYVLATTAAQALHDHSGHGHLGLESVKACGDERAEAGGKHAEQSGSHSDESEHSHQHRHAPAQCDDSCFACRLLAVKCVAPATLAVVEHVGFIRLIEEPASPLGSPARLALPLSRGPPA